VAFQETRQTRSAPAGRALRGAGSALPL
jgi:hypothetical protein